MAIGSGWVDGAWVDAGWVTGAWAQADPVKTIGGTSQLGAFTSSGTLTVVVPKTIGGSSQIGVFTSSGFIQVPSSTKGGDAGARRARERKAREEALRRLDERKEELAKLFPLGQEDTIRQLALTGKATIGGTEVEAPTIPQPIAPVFDPIKTEKLIELIEDNVTRELAIEQKKIQIAERQVAIEKHEAALRAHERELRLFEEQMMIFIMIAMLD